MAHVLGATVNNFHRFTPKHINDYLVVGIVAAAVDVVVVALYHMGAINIMLLKKWEKTIDAKFGRNTGIYHVD